MDVTLDRGEPDIIIPSEGTYPYVRGGVSSWIHQLMNGMPEYTFGIVFIGSRKEDYGEKKYEYPDNLVYVTEMFMFDFENKPAIEAQEGSREDFQTIRDLYSWFEGDHTQKFPQEIKNLDFYLNKIDEKAFLYSKESWNFILEKNLENCEDVPFIDYFWTVRNIHQPIWKMAQIAFAVANKGKLVHSPSTGYAGFLSSLIAHHTSKPFILTEHGIYTKERKIDLLSSTWITYHKMDLFKKPDEDNYVKKMWVKFFEGIGKMSYDKADPILSLFGGAKDVQIAFGADEKKCSVIPNGVNVHKLGATLKERPEGVPKVITLIGRVVSIKDIKTFIKAMKITADAIPEVEAWIVGPMDEDPEYAEECNEMVNALELNDTMKFLGFQNITDILPKSGLLTLTSISEGMPLVVLEGYAAGLPAVTTDVGSCKELIYGALNDEDIALGAAGKVCQIANASQLAEGYIEFLSDEEKWKKAQETALKRVNTFYTQELFLDTYRDVYKRFLD
jgi:glycosyltransferase involved in cell wall biosynthesis